MKVEKKAEKIPKIIHYCWFGPHPLPEDAVSYIAGWRRHCPDYQVMEWNETNFDISSSAFCQEAYRMGMWAFASDYARLKIIYEYGGIYLDTDIEIRKPLDPLIQDGTGFIGFQNEEQITTGLGFAAARHNPCVKEMLQAYEGRHFLLDDGTLDTMPCPAANTAALKRMGLRTGQSACRKIQILSGMRVFPMDYFNPLDMDTHRMTITENTYTIHHYADSWNGGHRKMLRRLKKIMPYTFLHERTLRIARKDIRDFEKRRWEEPKKLLFLIADISRSGGTERITADIAGGLAGRGYETNILSCRGAGKSCFPMDAKVNIYALHAEQWKNPVLRKLKNVISIYQMAAALHPDAVIAVDIYLYLYLLPLQFRKKCRCIAWEHFHYSINSKKMSKIARRLAMWFADQVVVLGKRDYKTYCRHFGRRKNLSYIYNAVSAPVSENKNMDRHRVIAAGRLVEQKGFDLLLDAWRLVEHTQDNDWTLDIFGTGPKLKELKELSRQYGLQRVYFKGYTAHLNQKMKEASLFVLSSRYEGFGLVLLEAQAAGLPCVSFDCREGPSEIIHDGVNGYLAEPGNTTQLAEKMLCLMNDESLRRRFSRMAQKDLNRFQPGHVLDAWEKMLSGLWN